MSRDSPPLPSQCALLYSSITIHEQYSVLDYRLAERRQQSGKFRGYNEGSLRETWGERRVHTERQVCRIAAFR